MSAFNRLKRGLDDAYKHRKKIKGAAQSIGHYINEVKRTATQQQKVRDMDAMTLGGTPVYRRLSISSTGSRTPTSSRTPSSGRKSGLSVLSAPSTRIPLKIVKKGNRRLKGTKHVKVSKLFKAKVKECSSANHVYGYFQANFKARILNQPDTNKTYIDDLAMCPRSLDGSLFSFANVLHAASRLWNGKAANATPQFLMEAFLTTKLLLSMSASNGLLCVSKITAIVLFEPSISCVLRSHSNLCLLLIKHGI